MCVCVVGVVVTVCVGCVCGGWSNYCVCGGVVINVCVCVLGGVTTVCVVGVVITSEGGTQDMRSIGSYSDEQRAVTVT